MGTIRRIGILTGGGDVPGLNVAIKAVAVRAQERGIEVVGLRRGWASVIGIDLADTETVQRFTVPLTPDVVRRIDRDGGTMLHSSRTNPSRVRAGDVPDHIAAADRTDLGDGRVDCTAHAVRVIEHLGLDAIVPIGGDDTLSFAGRLHHEGVAAVAIPKTMDNDVWGTDYCIGFSTAITRSVDMITNFRTALGSHERFGVVELFGRNSGETSLIAAHLADADRALIPEVPFELDHLVTLLQADREANPSRYALVTISEGAHPTGGDIVESGEEDAFGHKKLGGIGQATAGEIKRRTGVNIMFQQLGYVIRSGAPDSLDRMVAKSYGTLALDTVASGRSGFMVGLQGGSYTTVALDAISGKTRRVDVAALYDAADYRPRVADVAGKPMFLS
jgi:6-phosphofructokinase